MAFHVKNTIGVGAMSEELIEAGFVSLADAWRPDDNVHEAAGVGSG